MMAVDRNDGVVGEEKEVKTISMVSRKAAVYGLVVLVIIYASSFMQQYMLTGTIFEMANELHFGARECVVDNQTVALANAFRFNITTEQFCTEGARCITNSSDYVPDTCSWYYTGQGTEYDLLAGPIYLIIQGVATMPVLSLIQVARLRFNVALALLTLFFSAPTLLTAFVDDYWAVALLRFTYGVFSGPFVPLVFSFLSQVFPQNRQALVFGLAQFGALSGLSLGYLYVGASKAIGWRDCYVIAGSIGMGLSLVAILIVNPQQKHTKHQPTVTSKMVPSRVDWVVVVPVLISNTSRTASAYIFSYYLPVYLIEYYPDFDVAVTSLVVVVVSLPGCLMGGLVADFLHGHYGVLGRMLLILGLTLIALPIQTATLLVPAPYLVIPLGATLFISDFMYATTGAILSDLTPINRKTFLFGVNYFTSHSIGGAVNLLVTPTGKAFGLRGALLLLVLSLSAASGVFLAVAICLARKRFPGRTKMLITYEELEKEVEERTPLLTDSDF